MPADNPGLVIATCVTAYIGCCASIFGNRLQVGPSTAVAPAGRYLLYASTLAGTLPAVAAMPPAAQSISQTTQPPPGLEDVRAALAALVTLPAPEQQRQTTDGMALDAVLPDGVVAVREQNGSAAAARPSASLLLSYVQSVESPPQVGTFELLPQKRFQSVGTICMNVHMASFHPQAVK